ncbi:MAG: hypothetical protein DYG89_20095 [Caldilinea sp. CFX5]|nr:hypothetical protein [Caldilinea sp. CFX5]
MASYVLPGLTKRAQKALRIAEIIASTQPTPTVLPEHLLLAILLDPTCDGANALRALDVDEFALRLRLRKALPAAPLSPPAPEVAVASILLKEIATAAFAEAKQERLYYASTKHLLLALAQRTDPTVAPLLQAVGCTPAALRSVQGVEKVWPRVLPRNFAVSPVFVGLLLLTIVSGYVTYLRLFTGTWPVFLFVISGWLVSLSLHEFGHALVAYWGGDRSMIGKGYLSLNPLRYVHPLYSVLLPLLFLLAGSFALPGAAVSINEKAIQRPVMRTLSSAAGLLMNALLALLLALPFLFGLQQESWPLHPEFWSGLALLISLELFCVLICLTPVPGIDGYFMLQPYLSEQWQKALAPLSPYAFLLLWFIYSQVPIARAFYQQVLQWATTALQVDPFLIAQGWSFFRFWGIFWQ